MHLQKFRLHEFHRLSNLSKALSYRNNPHKFFHPLCGFAASQEKSILYAVDSACKTTHNPIPGNERHDIPAKEAEVLLPSSAVLDESTPSRVKVFHLPWF